MSKTGTNFDETLHISCRSEMRDQLIALAYLEGDNGNYARMARNLLLRALDDYIADLDERQRKRYSQVLDNVRAESVIRSQVRKERVIARLKKVKQLV